MGTDVTTNGGAALVSGVVEHFGCYPALIGSSTKTLLRSLSKTRDGPADHAKRLNSPHPTKDGGRVDLFQVPGQIRLVLASLRALRIPPSDLNINMKI